MQLKTRGQLGAALKSLGLNGYGVELGVADGWFSNQILLTSDLKTLFSVDPWSQTDKHECHLSSSDLYQVTVDTLRPYGHRSQIMKMYSYDAVDIFKDEFFDFIYIDACHTEDDCYQDMVQWFPKLKYGGIFAGHDYCDFHAGVVAAVDRFMVERQLSFSTTELDFKYLGHDIRSWYIVK